MDSVVTASTSASSTVVTESCLTADSSQSSNQIKLLEISLISAEDLASVSKSMQTYAVTWVNPGRKRTTQTDTHGHKNPEWTEKFIFRLNKDQMENATLTTEIYTVSWFRDVLVGTVHVPVKELITPLLLQNRHMHFVTLQVRRPSGAPQGKVNMGVALLDSTMRTTTININNDNNNSTFVHGEKFNEEEDIESKKLKEKIHLWRSSSTGSSNLTTGDDHQRISAHEGSEICSDIGPSASVVAAEGAIRLARQHDDTDDTASSILEVMTIEEAKARGYTVIAKERGDGEESSSSELTTSSRKSAARRKSDGGLFSCFAYGIEFTVVCGSNKPPTNKKKGSKSKNYKASEVNSV